MNQAIEIKFDFPLAHSDLTISLKATAEIHHSETYYVVDNFHAIGEPPGAKRMSILPPQEIKEVRRGQSKVWVHRDSERESLLSIAIGKGIEAASNNH